MYSVQPSSLTCKSKSSAAVTSHATSFSAQELQHGLRARCRCPTPLLLLHSSATLHRTTQHVHPTPSLQDLAEADPFPSGTECRSAASSTSTHAGLASKLSHTAKNISSLVQELGSAASKQGNKVCCLLSPVLPLATDEQRVSRRPPKVTLGSDGVGGPRQASKRWLTVCTSKDSEPD